MICNSGGAIGSDQVFEEECIKKEIPVIAWSFPAHKIKSPNKKNLTKDELDEGWEHVKKANETLKRNIYNLSPYVRNLLSRNWFQVKNSDAVFAIAFLEGKNKIRGGTGWCCSMAIDNEKKVYIFDDTYDSWFEYDYTISEFKKYDGIPTLINKFAGVGSRELSYKGTEAIKNLFSKSL